MKLADALATRRTANLDLVRLALAACVIVSHAWPLALGPGAPEPLSNLTGRSLGGWAVMMFFVLSGLLVTASAERRLAASFWQARVRRIFPGLAVALLVTLALAFASGASADLKEAAIWYIRALTLVSIEHRITGAFPTNPYTGVVNGPIWSLFYEVLAYGLCVLLVSAKVLRQKRAAFGLVLMLGLTLTLAPELPGRIGVFLPLFFAFSLGMAAYRLREELVLNPWLGALFLCVPFLLPGPVAVAAVAYGVLGLALCAPQVRLGADYSYGLYIYGWPVAQLVVSLLPGIEAVELALLSLLLTVPFAVISWYAVEAPTITRARAVVSS